MCCSFCFFVKVIMIIPQKTDFFKDFLFFINFFEKELLKSSRVRDIINIVIYILYYLLVYFSR
ncbi:MAG TPA: hypothetical protein DEW35_03720 [Ruminococcaceae bacterium]|nr:hypothetical protein [Oscillospiraceae bacterium]